MNGLPFSFKIWILNQNPTETEKQLSVLFTFFKFQKLNFI
jgi:hypothetical protein